MRRKEIPVEEVISRWLAGESESHIADDLDVSRGVISRCLARARTERPDLPWGERKAVIAASPTKQFTTMNDGK